MSQRYVVLVAIALISALRPATLALSQCNNRISLVPLTAMKAATKPQDFVRFRYSLSTSDTLLIRAHEDTETMIGPYDTGFAITRDEKVTQSLALRNLPEFRSDNPNFSFSDGFTTLAVTRACTNRDPIYFVTMQWMGDDISPALVFILVPSAQGYEVSTLPSISGGIVDVSIANPLHFRTWDSLHEGACNASSAYRITEYQIRNGKPIRTREYRTRHNYSSGHFDDRRRIRFIP